MGVVAGDALRAAFAEGLTVSAVGVILLHADVTAAAEFGDLFVLRNADEAAFRAHGHGVVRRIAAMAPVTGVAVGRMDAATPQRDRFSETARLARVAFDAHRLLGAGGAAR